MTITEVTTTVVSVPGSSLGFERPLGNITRQHRSLDYVLATVTAEDGAAGLGYAFTPGYGTQAIRAIIDYDLRRLVVGQDPADHQALWQRMCRGTKLSLSQVARRPAGQEVHSGKWASRPRNSADSADPAKPALAKSAAAYLGPQGAALFAISAVDVACWDLEAKRQGAPLWRLFGGSGDPIPTYVTFGFVSLTIPSCASVEQEAG